MDRSESVQREVVAFVELADLHNVLVERAAAHIGMDAPDRVDQILAGEHRVRVVGQISDNAEFFATDGLHLIIGKSHFETLRIDFCITEGERFVGDRSVACDVAIFDRLRGGAWWRAPLASTVIGSALDTAIFFTIAFSASVSFFSEAQNAEISWAWDSATLLLLGGEAPLWVSLAIADWGVKLLLALIALVPFRVLIARLQSHTKSVEH